MKTWPGSMKTMPGSISKNNARLHGNMGTRPARRHLRARRRAKRRAQPPCSVLWVEVGCGTGKASHHTNIPSHSPSHTHMRRRGGILMCVRVRLTILSLPLSRSSPPMHCSLYGASPFRSGATNLYTSVGTTFPQTTSCLYTQWSTLRSCHFGTPGSTRRLEFCRFLIFGGHLGWPWGV